MKTTARKLDIVLRSAAGLKKVNSSRMAAYAVAWIEPSLRVPSPMDKRHGRNPVWDTTISMTLDERVLGQAGKRLHIELLGQGLVSTKPIGFVIVDMTDLLSQGSDGAAVSAPFHDYPVTRRSGRQQGVLNFELCLQASPTLTPSVVRGEPAMDAASPVESTSRRAASPVESTSRRAPSFTQSQRELSKEPPQYETGSHKFSSKSPWRESHDMDYDFAVRPTATTRRGYNKLEKEEISRLDSYGRATVVSHFH